MVFALDNNVADVERLLRTPVADLQAPEIPDPLAMASLVSRALLPIAATPEAILSVEQPSSDKPLGVDPVDGFLKTLRSTRGRTDPEPISIRGVFFGCYLMFTGWWARTEDLVPNQPAPRQPGERVQSVRNIRHWLNTGFEQWGPSWDLTDPGQADRELYGQIGHGDEANSLPVIVAPGKARQTRFAMGSDLAISATVTGTLYHRKYLNNGLNRQMRRAVDRLLRVGMESSHFVVVCDEVDDHKIERMRDGPEVYSAYLWQCLVPSKDKDRAQTGSLHSQDTIFLWEHTNLLDADSVKFNFDALNYKREYLERIIGDKLLILQQSYPVHDIVGDRPADPLVGPSTLSELLLGARTSVHDGPPENA